MTRYEKKEEEKQNKRRNCLRLKISLFIMISSSIANINMTTIPSSRPPLQCTVFESTVVIVVEVIAIFAITKCMIPMRMTAVQSSKPSASSCYYWLKTEKEK